MSLLFNMLSSLVIVFLPRSKPSFNFMAAVTVHRGFRAHGNKICHYFHFFCISLPWSDGTRCHDHNKSNSLNFLFPSLSLPPFHPGSSKGVSLLGSSSFSLPSLLISPLMLSSLPLSNSPLIFSNHFSSV